MAIDPGRLILRLTDAVSAVAPIEGLALGTPGVPASVRVDFAPSATGPQQTAAQAVVTAFDWSQAAQDAWENLRARTTAKSQLDLGSADPKLLRALASIIMDELNLLRAVVVGRVDFVFNPASMANGTGVTKLDIAVAGAAFGDEVSIVAPYTLGGLVCTGYVHSAGLVAVRLHNSTGAAVDPASGTWTAIVRRQLAMPPRTLIQLRNAIKTRLDDGSVDT